MVFKQFWRKLIAAAIVLMVFLALGASVMLYRRIRAKGLPVVFISRIWRRIKWVALDVVILLLVLVVFLSRRWGQGRLVFMNWVNWPPCDFSQPTKPKPLPWGLSRRVARWFGADAYDGVENAVSVRCDWVSGEGARRSMGGWVMPPIGPETPERAIGGGRAVLYLHGNAGNRAVAHRVRLYQLLRRLGYC